MFYGERVQYGDRSRTKCLVLSAALFRGNGVIHRGINRFKEMTTVTSGVLARFPWLLPVRNSVASYGASAVTRTSDRGRVAEVGNHRSGGVPPLMSTCAVSSKHKDAEHLPVVVWMID